MNIKEIYCSVCGYLFDIDMDNLESEFETITCPFCGYEHEQDFK